jgi:hypothetical protein
MRIDGLVTDPAQRLEEVLTYNPHFQGLILRSAKCLWLANCCFAHIPLGFPVLLRFCDEQPGHSFYPFPIATLARLLGPGGVRSIVAESLILKHQLLIVNRSRQRSPNLCTSDRILAGLMALLVRPTRLLRSAIVLKPSTLLRTEPHDLLTSL